MKYVTQTDNSILKYTMSSSEHTYTEEKSSLSHKHAKNEKYP